MMKIILPKEAELILKSKLRQYKKLYVEHVKLTREGCTCDIGSPHGCPYCNNIFRLEAKMNKLLGT